MLLAGIAILFLMINVSIGQEEGKWEFFDTPVVGYAEATDEGEAKVNLKGFRNPYGVAVDTNGNIWFSAYWPIYYFDEDGTTQIFPDDVDGKHTCPIYILKTDGDIDTLKFLIMPDASTDTLFGGCRGMTKDANGNILHISLDVLYQIDPESRSVINYFQLPDQGACPAADSLGYIYVTTLLEGNPLYILDCETLSIQNTVFDNTTLWKRNIAVSPYGTDIYIGIITSTDHVNWGLAHYHSDNGPNGNYMFSGTIFQNYGSYTNIPLPYVQWDPAGLIWIGTQQEAELRMLWSLDPDDEYNIADGTSFTIWDTLSTDTTTGGYPQPYYIRAPRDAAFSADGKIMYIADFYGYTIKEFHYEITSSMEKPHASTSLMDYELAQNYPNPFNPATTIAFHIPEPDHVTIEIFSVSGQKISTLVNRSLPAGKHSVSFDGGNLVSGIYYYRIVSGSYSRTHKMLLVK